MKILEQFISYFDELDEASASKFINLATVKKYKKGVSLVKEGKIQKKFYIIKSGIIRSYYTDKNDKIRTRTFFTKMDTCGDIGALITNSPAKLSYDCLSDYEVYIINHHTFMKLVKKEHSFSKVCTAFLSKVVIRFEAKIYAFSVLNATERYLKLKEMKPQLENRIPQYQIASFLNITPVQLSRIRKEIYTK